ncbi:tetratricopeptide repeat protein [Paenibacillus sp. 1P07SE]|uniref:tetratricopeptide repeat protein n=1 Tax=Paenibacillus sp. 1P07SE TaxID=3132209 RepID=UPI0039A44182
MNGDEAIKKAYESILGGDFEQAVVWFEQAIAACPDEADYHYRCSITCARSAKWSKAMHHAEEAVRLDGAHQEYKYHLDTVTARMMAVEAAQLLESEPQSSEAAISLLERSIELDPLHGEAYLLLGAALAERSRYTEAVSILKTLLELDPQHGPGRRLYAEYRRKRRAALSRAGRTIRRRNR